jgi:HK97 family phage portal protein
MDMVDIDDLEVKSFGGSSDFLGYSDLGGIVDPRLLKSIYQSEDWVYILNDRIASKLAQIPWRVMRRVVKDGSESFEPQENHPVQLMIDYPNPLQSAYEFKYASITDLSVTGNSLIYISRQNKWLVQVPVELLQLDVNTRGDLNGYYITGIDPMAFPAGSRTKLLPRDVIHVKRPNPSSVYWGLSPLIPGSSSTMFNKFSTEYLLNFYRKGAQPGLVLEATEEMNVEQAKKILALIEQNSTGRRNQRKGLLLPKGTKPHKLADTLADQQLIDYLHNNRETLINIYGVPKHELSIAEVGSLGSEEYKTALKNFWQGPLMSIGSMFETAMTLRLSQFLGQGYVIKLDYSNVPILQEDLMEKSNVAASMLSTMTYNEVRAKIWKLPPIPGGDTLRDLRQPAFPQFQAPQIEVPQQELSTKEIGYKEANIEAFSNYIKAEGNGWFNESQDRQEQEAKKSQDKLEKLWLKILEEQIVAAVKVAKKHLQEKALETPSKAKLKKDIKQAMDKLEEEWTNGYTDTLSGQVELGYDTLLEIPFNEPYKPGIQAIRARNENKRREMLEMRALDSFDQMTKTTTEQIMRIIENGMKESSTLQEVAAKIMDKANISAGRAMTISRTETLIARSLGEAAAAQDAKEVIPNLVKVWINANDSRVRGNPNGEYPDSEADHWRLMGEIVDIDEEFENGLRYPRDLKGPANEIINCRCSLLTVSADDLPQLGLKR